VLLQRLPDVVEVLLGHGADPAAPVPGGGTVFSHAVVAARDAGIARACWLAVPAPLRGAEAARRSGDGGTLLHT
jgi:hypothetical protein